MLYAPELNLQLMFGQRVAGEGLVYDQLVADDGRQHRPRLQVAHAGEVELPDRRRSRSLATAGQRRVCHWVVRLYTIR